jgi:hypothetical protein
MPDREDKGRKTRGRFSCLVYRRKIGQTVQWQDKRTVPPSPRYAFDKARSLGKTAIVLWVLADNTDSICFYEKCGFAADGKAKDLEYGKILKGMRMRRTL